MSLNYYGGFEYKYNNTKGSFESFALSGLGLTFEYSNNHSYTNKHSFYFGLDSRVSIGLSVGAFVAGKFGWKFDFDW